MRILLSLCFAFLVTTSSAQKLDHRLGFIIVQLEDESDLLPVLRDNSRRIGSDIKPDKTLSARLVIHLISFDFTRVHERELLSQLRTDRRIRFAQFDHITTLRKEPNDPLFASQWQWVNTGQTGGLIDADIDADLAWDISQGGITATGDTIVVAIIDDGINYNHPDIEANTWVNHGEIADNGFDDDGNGYVDDVFGWNVYDDSPDVLSSGHGLSVAGMIGAKGNNSIGITGINWHVKLMAIVGGTPESAAIASYAYALEQRILYEETQGAKGAFVVATNSSWGIDYGQPEEAPLWCAFYDSLGFRGILSAAATANNSDNIDSVGDLPTACTSEYLLSVTALNHDNQRTFSAFGKEHVDFGAPGSNIFTTQGSDGYGNTSGTSFASPVAAGLVALLYSAPCLGIAELAHTNPAGAALYVRDLIFNGVEKLPQLEDETKYGGALNAGNSMNLLLSLCSECPIPFGISSNNLTDTETIIEWLTTDTADAINLRYQIAGSTDWDTLLNVETPLLLSGLTGCTDYILEFESICADTSTGFQVGHSFKTLGCCELPASINAIPNETSFFVNWSHVFAAEYYLLQWRPEGDPDWMEVVTSLDEMNIDLLQPCTFYEFRLQTNCDTTETGFSDIMRIRTRGCGNCIDLFYCEAGSEDSSEEHLDSLKIGPLVNHSGNNGGYILYEDLSPVFNAGEKYPVEFRPGFDTGEKFDEQFRVWLDINQDGIFDETELLLDTILLEIDTVLYDTIMIPSDAVKGNTRMRVIMSYYNPPFITDPGPCEVVDFGEVEDYCVTIDRLDNYCDRVDTVVFDAINFTGAFMYWPSAENAIAYVYRYREAGSTDFIEIATIDTTAVLSGLEKCKMYEVQIMTVCVEDTTSYDSVYMLETECDVAVQEADPLLTFFNAYPNPFSDHLSLKMLAHESGDYRISLYDIQGRKFLAKNISLVEGEETGISFHHLSLYPLGLYVVTVECNGRTMARKIMKAD